MLDLNWILPDLAVGGALAEAALPSLAREHEIRAVVDCRGEACDPVESLRALGVAFLHLPTPDGAGLVQQALDQGVSWVNAQLAHGHRTLIHCQYGMGRSALLSLCVLVSRGHRPLEAFELARERRRVITLSASQMGAYRSWLARKRPELPDADWEVPSLEALSQISWGAPPGAATGRRVL